MMGLSTDTLPGGEKKAGPADSGSRPQKHGTADQAVPDEAPGEPEPDYQANMEKATSRPLILK